MSDEKRNDSFLVVDMFDDSQDVTGVDMARVCDLFWDRYDAILMVSLMPHSPGPQCDAHFYVNATDADGRLDSMRGFVEGMVDAARALAKVPR